MLRALSSWTGIYQRCLCLLYLSYTQYNADREGTGGSPLPATGDDDSVIETILDRRRGPDASIQYLVKWRGEADTQGLVRLLTSQPHGSVVAN